MGIKFPKVRKEKNLELSMNTLFTRLKKAKKKLKKEERVEEIKEKREEQEEEKKTSEEGEKLICPSCGRENPPDSNFCMYCGEELK